MKNENEYVVIRRGDKSKAKELPQKSLKKILKELKSEGVRIDNRISTLSENDGVD